MPTSSIEGVNEPRVARVAVDVPLPHLDRFFDYAIPDELAEKVQQINTSEIQISMITNRGIKVWPDGFSETFCTDHWRCRFKPLEGKSLDKLQIIQLLGAAHEKGIDVVKTENLYAFDGKPAFSLGQGQ